MWQRAARHVDGAGAKAGVDLHAFRRALASWESRETRTPLLWRSSSRPQASGPSAGASWRATSPPRRAKRFCPRCEGALEYSPRRSWECPMNSAEHQAIFWRRGLVPRPWTCHSDSEMGDSGDARLVFIRRQRGADSGDSRTFMPAWRVLPDHAQPRRRSHCGVGHVEAPRCQRCSRCVLAAIRRE